jgi:excinuclease UvrABC nuclease subunit
MERAELKRFELPDTPGVYLFKKGKKVLYVGKATSLRDRVRSYFDDDLIATRGPRLVDMVTQADRVAHEPTPTVLEALVREAALIRKYDPPANSLGKDDKSFLYAVITDEAIPRVLAYRGTDIDFDAKVVIPENLKVRETYGPFTSGYQLREGLRLIRRIFPFYDTDKPLTIDATSGRVVRAQGNKHHQAKVEFNRQIGQYPHEFDKKEYARSIRRVGLFLSGKTKELRTLLNKEMKEAAQDERFEDAGELRHQLFALDHIQDVSLIKEDRSEDKESPRIEAYDTAHISGTNAIGVMVVIDAGVPVKKDYRTFRIRGKGGKKLNDDIASLKELISRRLPHTEWQYPKAIVVDGGKTHKKAAEEVLKGVGVAIPVIAVVKDDKHRPREVLGSARAGVKDADVVLANSEAHRFSLSRHRRARSRALRS